VTSRFWLTRTQPGADRQAAELGAAGYQVLVAPVLSVLPVAAAAPVEVPDIVIFLSEHAVNCVVDLAFCDDALVLAIGIRTQEVLQAAGIDARVPAEERSEGLLQMPELAQLQGKRVLVVAGQDGRGVLEAELTARGAQVAGYRCYRRVAVDNLEVAVAAVDGVVVASGDGLQAMARFWLAAGGRVDVPVLVPSARVAELARQQGFTRVIECSGADSRAIMSALKRIAVA
jgi:uroporphyrinogen-III synthase